MRLILLATAALMAAPSYAQPQQLPPPHQACQGDPKCAVVPDDDPRLDDANAIYYPDTDMIYLSAKRILTGDCAKYLYEHEAFHRRQHQEGRLKWNVWAELEAQQEAPIYNCGSDGPSGAIGRYEVPPLPGMRQ